MTLQGKKAVVTGAAGGIGWAVTMRLANQGADVVALDVDRAALDARLHQPPAEMRDRVSAVTCDCGDSAQVNDAVNRVIGEHGRVDILVNNAGINPAPRPVTHTDEPDWDRVQQANAKSVYLVSKAVIPHMPEGGCIVNFASILAFRGVRSCSAYAASKAAIVALTRSMALDYAPRLRVNCVCPGAIDTPMFTEYLSRCVDPQAQRQLIEQSIPLRRIGTPDDVAAVVAFLASPDAAWITGTTLTVDGGDSV